MSYDNPVPTEELTDVIAGRLSDPTLLSEVSSFLSNEVDRDSDGAIQLAGFEADGEIGDGTIDGDLEGGVIQDGDSFEVDLRNGLIVIDNEDGATVNVDVVSGDATLVIGSAGPDVITLTEIDGEASNESGVTTIVDTGDGDDSVSGTAAAETFALGDGDDSVEAGDGDDSISGGGGDDSVEGGDGYDEFSVGGIRGNFTVTVEDGDVVLTASSDTSDGQVDTLSGVEYVRFADNEVLIGVEDQDQGDVARLYEVIFDRSADAAGLQFWLNSLADGLSATAAAEFFAESDEFTEATGNLSNEEFVGLLYEQGLDREADDAGLAFWSGALEDGTITRSNLALAFAISEEAEDLYDNILIIDEFDLG